MEEIFKAWLLIAFTLGLWTCAQLLIHQRRNDIKFCLFSFVALLILPTANAYMSLVLGKSLPLINALSQNLTLAYGPILLLSCRTLLGRETQLALFSVHFLPFFLVCFDRTLGGQVTNKGHGLFFIGFLFVHVFVYLGLSLKSLYRERVRVIHLGKNHRNSSYYWLLFLIVGLAVVMLFDLGVISYMLTLQQFPNPIFIAISVSALSVYINLIALGALIQPTLLNTPLFNTERFNTEQPSYKQQDTNQANTSSMAKQTQGQIQDLETAPETVPETAPPTASKTPTIRQVELSPEQAHALDQQLMSLVEDHSIHLDESISLAKLASLLGITRNQLSELLNIHKQLSFYEFLNQLRLKEALALMSDTNNKLTNIDIAYKAGFNNRNSFYKVFKQATGMTPSEYQKTLAS